ncbi:tRNA-splicing endonuclease subunit [Pestalotiopsis sp. 9143b]|nr:tRNA-splicing endonuclease subunit [Pestalotiopsis sp. 9143b]
MASDGPNRPPVRISKVTDRYLLFDIDDIMHLRRHHNICSPFVGTMPQAPSQSVFMGLPVELMAEEAAVLVREGAAYVVDDSAFHPSRLASPGRGPRAAYLEALRRDGLGAAAAAREYAEYRKAQGLSKAKAKGKKAQKTKAEEHEQETPPVQQDAAASSVVAEEEESLGIFDSPAPQEKVTKPSHRQLPSSTEPYAITPVTSGALLTPPPEDEEEDTASLIDIPRGYPLFAHLHDHGYYMMPGLRFGCDYNVYPGDPLRYHSHFQATHHGWTDGIQLLDLVGGGRLGTNVKKAYLIGGASAGVGKAGGEVVGGHGVKAKSPTGPPVRAFSIEWAAM